MESPEPTSAKFKLWRWLLLLSVITIALGGLVWWKSRSERLQFVEPIWSDSLAGHENDAATGQRRKIGELWSLNRSAGCVLFGRGLNWFYTGQYPAFTPTNAFLQAVSDQLQTECRESAAESASFDWSSWWHSVKEGPPGKVWGQDNSLNVLFLNEHAVSLRQTICYAGGAHIVCDSIERNFIERNGASHEVELAELFVRPQWVSALSDLCVNDLLRQGASEIVSNPAKKFSAADMAAFALTSDGLTIYFASYSMGEDVEGDFEVLIPYEKLAEHLKPDGPHRLFQTKGSE